MSLSIAVYVHIIFWCSITVQVGEVVGEAGAVSTRYVVHEGVLSSEYTCQNGVLVVEIMLG